MSAGRAVSSSEVLQQPSLVLPFKAAASGFAGWGGAEECAGLMGPASCAQHHTEPVSTIDMAPCCFEELRLAVGTGSPESQPVVLLLAQQLAQKRAWSSAAWLDALCALKVNRALGQQQSLWSRHWHLLHMCSLGRLLRAVVSRCGRGCACPHCKLASACTRKPLPARDCR